MKQGVYQFLYDAHLNLFKLFTLSIKKKFEIEKWVISGKVRCLSGYENGTT